MMRILEDFARRRSIYGLSDKIQQTPNDITNLVKQCVKDAPSAFNSQSGRVVILFGQNHQTLWQIVLKHLQKVTPPEKFSATEEKIASFAAAFGTILFFEDEAVIKQLQQQYPLYKEAAPQYSCQSSGMLQFMVWTALASENIGASLQHYNPLIDEDVKKQWQLPDSWLLMSQMPFGAITQPAGDKAIQPLTDRVKVFDGAE